MRIVVVISFIFCALQCHTQDLSLSQFHNVPALINPAAVGNFPEQYRITAGHKRQWGALANPFVTSFFSAEGSLTKNRRGNYPTIGLLAVTDKAGKSGYEASIYRAMGAYRFKLKRYKYLSFGLELGFNQRKFSLDGLSWDSQFNGAGYDPSLPTNESFSNQTINDLDAGFGAEYSYENPRELSWKAGIGLHHYYQQRSVLANGEDFYPTLGQIYWIGQQTKGSLKWNYYALLQSQNLTGAISGAVGGEVFYRFNYDSKYTNHSSSSSVSLGALYRYNDAVTALVGFEYKRIFKISMSYDVTVSSWSSANTFRGGPELMLTYLGNLQKTKKRKL